VLRPARSPSGLRQDDRLLRGLQWSLLLVAAFVVLTVFAAGPLQTVDEALNSRRDVAELRPVLHLLDRIGQRAICLPVLVLVGWVVSRRIRSWRPMVVAAVAVLALNALVAALKFGLQRGAPLENQPAFLAGGEWYPSGHTANVVLVYGLAAYLWCHYTRARRRTAVILAGIVAALTVLMVATSLTLRWHWFTDLIGGVMVGAAVLQAVVTIDRLWPLRARPQPPVSSDGRHGQDAPVGPLRQRSPEAGAAIAAPRREHAAVRRGAGVG
jgi:membrane-associated phospholipid phosphatase